MNLYLLEGWCFNFLYLGSVLFLLFATLGFFSLLPLLANHLLHACRQLCLHFIVFTVGRHQCLQITRSFLIFLLDLISMGSSVQGLFVGFIEVFNDKSAVRGNTCLLVEQMETSCTVSVDLGDLCLDVTMVEWSTDILKQLDSLTKVFHGLLVGLLSELIVSFLFECGKFVLDL